MSAVCRRRLVLSTCILIWCSSSLLLTRRLLSLMGDVEEEKREDRNEEKEKEKPCEREEKERRVVRGNQNLQGKLIQVRALVLVMLRSGKTSSAKC